MSVDTNAILMWGFDLREEIPLGSVEKMEKVMYANNFKATIEYHCCDDLPMYFAGIEKSHILTWRGETEIIKPSNLIVGPDWEEELRRLCEVSISIISSRRRNALA